MNKGPTPPEPTTTKPCVGSEMLRNLSSCWGWEAADGFSRWLVMLRRKLFCREQPRLKKAAQNAKVILANTVLSFSPFFFFPSLFFVFLAFCSCSALQLKSSLSWFPTQSYLVSRFQGWFCHIWAAPTWRLKSEKHWVIVLLFIQKNSLYFNGIFNYF